jgi:hypothetical protein
MSQDSFEQRSRELLEESARRIDGRTQSRLTQARHAALDRAARHARPGWRLWVPAGAAAAVAALAVLSWQPAPPGVSPVEDLELLTDADAPDFLDEAADLEFYVWAADEMES